MSRLMLATTLFRSTIDISERDLRFTRYWEEWARSHRDFLKEGDKLFDRSYHFEDTERGGDQTLAGYAHIRKYRFLINPDVIDQIADLELDLDAAPDQNLAQGKFTRGASHSRDLQAAPMRSMADFESPSRPRTSGSSILSLSRWAGD